MGRDFLLKGHLFLCVSGDFIQEGLEVRDERTL